MDEPVQDLDIPNVYEYLLSVQRTDESYGDTAAMISKVSPIYPGDPGWQDMIARYGNRVAIFLLEGLMVIGMAQEGRCIGCCGYRMVSDARIVVRGHEVKLPYEMFMAVEDEAGMGADLIYSAQMFIADREGLKVVQMA